MLIYTLILWCSCLITQAQPSTSAEVSGQFGTGTKVSYGTDTYGTSAEMSWVRCVLSPKCFDTTPYGYEYNAELQNAEYRCGMYNSDRSIPRSSLLYWGISYTLNKLFLIVF